MRTILATALMFLAALSSAQQPSTPAERLDLVLKYWEVAMTRVQSLEAECERITKDKTFKTEETYKGRARFLKSAVASQPSRASLELVKVDNPQVFEKLVMTGNFLYEFAPSQKEIRVHELPPAKPGESVDHNLMALLFGMKSDDAKKRYQIQLEGEDQNYFYLKIVPTLDRDKADFAAARLALVRTTYLPRQLWFLQANGNEVKWDLPRVNDKAHLTPNEFQQPQLPAGWKYNRIPLATPTKIRSTGM